MNTQVVTHMMISGFATLMNLLKKEIKDEDVEDGGPAVS